MNSSFSSLSLQNIAPKYRIIYSYLMAQTDHSQRCYSCNYTAYDRMISGVWSINDQGKIVLLHNSILLWWIAIFAILLLSILYSKYYIVQIFSLTFWFDFESGASLFAYYRTLIFLGMVLIQFSPFIPPVSGKYKKRLNHFNIIRKPV